MGLALALTRLHMGQLTFTSQAGQGSTFAFFAGMMVLQLLYVWKLMPETKGKTLEEADKVLVMH
jgi:hypothetical protein